jgi:type II secretory pathway pseudopilin PulG
MRKTILILKSQISNVKSFTLVELLVFMGIFLILLAVLTQIFVSTLNVQLESQATSSVQQDGRYIIARLSYDINRAEAITAPSTLGTDPTHPDTLQLTIGSETYTYTTTNNQLTLQVAAGQAQPLTSFGTTISNLTFTRIGTLSNKDSIQIVFTLTSTSSSGKGPEIKSFQSSVGLRGN